MHKNKDVNNDKRDWFDYLINKNEIIGLCGLIY